jgi:phosphatidylethanolamine-binding protein (PEBP) family uncharacterized protein
VNVPKGSPEPGLTPKQRSQATVLNIALSSPAVRSAAGSTASLPAAYTCDGKDSWPALHWQGVPAGTAELVLFAMSVQPVNGDLFFDWAVSGLDPALNGIEAGSLPRGAVMGRNGFGKAGYSICPAEGGRETYVFALYALPKELHDRRGFDPAALREQANRASRDAGLMAVSYARG